MDEITTRRNLFQRIRNSARYCRSEGIKRKVRLFLKGLKLGNVAKACRQLGTYSQYYYYWWKQYEKAGFNTKALEEKSRRPKRNPRKIHQKTVKWIEHYRRERKYGLDQIQLSLIKDH